MVEHRLEEGVPVNADAGAENTDHEADDHDDADGATGDRIITASGEMVEVGGSARMMEDDRVNWLSYTRRKPWQPIRSLLPPDQAGPATKPARVHQRWQPCFLTTCPAWLP